MLIKKFYVFYKKVIKGKNMEIGNNYYLNFKGKKHSKRNTDIQSKKREISAPALTKAPVSVLKAYNLTDSSRGIANATVTPNYDSLELVYTLKAPDLHSDRVKFIYSFGDEKELRETSSCPKNIETGELKIRIPVLNRKTNSIYPSLKIHSAEYFNETNEKIGEEIPENMVIKPESVLTLKELRTAVIDGETNSAELDSISEGISVGKLIKTDYEDIIRYKGTEPVIAILSEEAMSDMFMQIADGSFTLPMNVKGLIMSPPHYKQGFQMTDFLGHAVSRIRGRKIFALMDKQTLDKIERKYYNNPENPFVQIKLDADKMEVTGLKRLPKADDSHVKVPEYKFVNSLITSEDEDFTPETAGLKAYNLGRLKKLQKAGGFSVPEFFVVPSGMLNEVKKSPENADTYGDNTNDIDQIGAYHFLVKKADSSENPAEELKLLRKLIIEGIILPKEIREQLKSKSNEIFGIYDKDKNCLIARSSFNGEDSDTMATQGLYDSFPGIRSSEDIYKGIKEVWASKWSDLAYMSRRNHKIPHKLIQPNVIIQKVIPVDYTFTAYTADARKNDKNKIVIELSQGVYSGFPNSPYIFEYDKTTGEIQRKTLATKKRAKTISNVEMNDVMNEKYIGTDYSKDPLNLSKKHYAPVMKKVFETAKFIEDKFGGKPQDIEGGIIFRQNEKTGELVPEIHIWQTRDVHMVNRNH